MEGRAPDLLHQMVHQIVWYNENSGRLGEKIRTVTSDLHYPWPSGKAPWAVERGGSGVPPPGAGLDTFLGQARASEGKMLPSPWSVIEARSQQEAEHMVRLGRTMLEMAIKFGVGEGVVIKDEGCVIGAAIQSRPQ